MDMPKPSDKHRRLHVLVGTWAGEEKLSPSPWGPGGAAVGRSVCRAEMEGFFVIQDYVEEKEGRIVCRGHSVFGYDAQSDEYTWYWVDSMGFPPAAAARGRWEGDTIVFRSKSPQGEGRYTYRFEGDHTYHFRLEN